MSKEKLTRHEKDCIPEGKKGYIHFFESKSFAVDESGNRITKRDK